MKTKKALKKRFKVTKNGKVLRPATGQNHYKRKKSGRKLQEKRKWVKVSGALAKKIKKHLK